MSTSTWPWMYEFGEIDYGYQEQPASGPVDVCKYHDKRYLAKYKEKAYSREQHADIEEAIKKHIACTILKWPLCNYECAPVGLYYKWERDTGGMWVVTPYWQCLPCATTAAKGGKSR